MLNLRAVLLLFISGGVLFSAHAGGDCIVDSMPANYLYGELQSPPYPVEDQWWKSFDDSLLDSLIAAGCANNYDLRIAAKRVAIARESVRQAKSAYYPTVGVSAGWSRSRESGYAGTVKTPAVTSSAFSIGANMSWEIDLFGKIGSSVKQSKALMNATKAEMNGAMVSMCAEIATQYCALRTYQAEYAVVREHIKSQSEVLKIVEARHEAGLASKLDVAQAKMIYYSTQSLLPQVEASIDVTINAIAVLLGVYPGELAPRLKEPAPLPDYRRLLATGVPMDLLRRRPDVVAAEYELAADAAALGIAKKDFLPTLTLEGSVGSMAHSAKNLMKKGSLTYTIAPTLSWTLFDGMSRKAAVVSAREQMQMAMDQYNLTVLTAVQEVENAMAQYFNELKELDLIQRTLDEANEAFKLSLDLYKGGLSDFTDVANAQISMLEYADRLTTTQGSTASQLITLYRAIGGGWDNYSDNTK